MKAQRRAAKHCHQHILDCVTATMQGCESGVTLQLLHEFLMDEKVIMSDSSCSSSEEGEEWTGPCCTTSLAGHEYSGLEDGPCFDGVPVHIYKCMLVCVQQQDPGSAEVFEAFQQYLPDMMAKFTAAVEQWAQVVEKMEANNESVNWGTSDVEDPGDLTVFLDNLSKCHMLARAATCHLCNHCLCCLHHALCCAVPALHGIL